MIFKYNVSILVIYCVFLLFGCNNNVPLENKQKIALPSIPGLITTPSPKPSSSFKPVNIKSEMVEMRGGTFQMGDTFGEGAPDELPVHAVTTDNFNIGKFEVSQIEFQSLMGNNPSEFKGESLPVENVSWSEAIKFCNSKSLAEGLPVSYNETTGELLDGEGHVTDDLKKVIGYRLPTEAEWEYAAKGGNAGNVSKPFLYSGSDNPDEIAWYKDNSQTKTHPVGAKKANESGLYDMSGNVWEWCYDSFINYSEISHDNSYNFNPNSSSHVYRGGDAGLESVYMRPSFRAYYNPLFIGRFVGFRLVKSKQENTN